MDGIITWGKSPRISNHHDPNQCSIRWVYDFILFKSSLFFCKKKPNVPGRNIRLHSLQNGGWKWWKHEKNPTPQKTRPSARHRSLPPRRTSNLASLHDGFQGQRLDLGEDEMFEGLEGSDFSRDYRCDWLSSSWWRCFCWFWRCCLFSKRIVVLKLLKCNVAFEV